jgi:hypothetical protein
MELEALLLRMEGKLDGHLERCEQVSHEVAALRVEHAAKCATMDGLVTRVDRVEGRVDDHSRRIVEVETSARVEKAKQIAIGGAIGTGAAILGWLVAHWEKIRGAAGR